MDRLRDVLNQIVPIFVAALLAWATWLTVESNDNKVAHAEMLTRVEGRELRDEAITTTQNQLDELIQTVRDIDDKLDTLAERQAAILADLEHVKNALD